MNGWMDGMGMILSGLELTDCGLEKGREELEGGVCRFPCLFPGLFPGLFPAPLNLGGIGKRFIMACSFMLELDFAAS